MSPNKDLTQTNFTAHLNAPIIPGQNLIYCATFQLAWNELIDNIIHAPIALTGNPVTAQTLNKRQFEKSEIDEACYLAVAGFGADGIVEKIKNGLKERFNREPSMNITAEPLDIISYAYLEKNLPFDTTFDVFNEPLFFNGAFLVQSFGIYNGDAASDQVVILDYSSPDDFIIKLQTSPKVDKAIAAGTFSAQHPRITDEIILAKVTPAATLLETVNSVFSRIEEEKFQALVKGSRNEDHSQKMIQLMPFLESNGPEILQIPKINFDIKHHFNELENQTLLNPGFESYTIRKAIQSIKFDLNETGAKVSSEGFMDLSFGAVLEPRRFIFDKPFLCCLREKGSHRPYLVLWINNSDLLVKA